MLQKLIPLFVAFVLVSARTSPPRTSVLSNKKVVVVGGGPVGLYFAALLLESDPTVRIEILETEERSTPSSSIFGKTESLTNAFGLGVGGRMQNRLKDIPGLYEKAVSVSSIVGGLNIPLVSRDDLVTNMRIFLQDRCTQQKISNNNCKVNLGEGCASVDLRRKKVTTDKGRIIPYDLLLGADGVNSKIRQFIIDQTDDAALEEEHFTLNAYWKALQLPKQPDIEADSFRPIRNPAIGGGRFLPRAPEGHFVLLYWRRKSHDPTTDNPIGIRTTEDWKQLLNHAIQDKEVSRFSIRKMTGYDIMGDSCKKDRKLVFDERALADFVNTRAKLAHYLKLGRYHYQKGSVALIGDSAHSFSSLLGQGCATGLESTHTLVKCLLESDTTLDDALLKYTELATIESHAMTEVSLIEYAIRGGFNAMTFKAVPLILWNMLRGKGLLKQIRDIHVPFSTIARENSRVLAMCRKEFEKERMPFLRRQ